MRLTTDYSDSSLRSSRRGLAVARAKRGEGQGRLLRWGGFAPPDRGNQARGSGQAFSGTGEISFADRGNWTRGPGPPVSGTGSTTPLPPSAGLVDPVRRT